MVYWYRAQRDQVDAVEGSHRDSHPPFPERLPLDDPIYTTRVQEAAAGVSGMSLSPSSGNNHYVSTDNGMVHSHPTPNVVQDYQQQLGQQQRLISQARQ